MDLEANIKMLHPEAYRWSLTMCRGKKELAADVLQEVYLKILEGKAKFAGRSSFQTWLFSLIRNTAIDQLRRKNNHLALEADVEYTFADMSATEDQGVLWEQLLNRLSAMQLAVLQLVFYHQCTLEEASGILGVPLGTVSTHYKRGKERLKNIIDHHGLESKIRGYE